VVLMTDCEKCMQAYTKPIRQGWACGYEPPAPEGAIVEAWSGLGYRGDRPTICPGYTTTLPETIEIARAWKWWVKGELAAYVDGAPVSHPLKMGIEIFDGAVGALERWLMTPADKGGGRES
jgi:hypothetical protein